MTPHRFKKKIIKHIMEALYIIRATMLYYMCYMYYPSRTHSNRHTHTGQSAGDWNKENGSSLNRLCQELLNYFTWPHVPSGGHKNWGFLPFLLGTNNLLLDSGKPHLKALCIYWCMFCSTHCLDKTSLCPFWSH